MKKKWKILLFSFTGVIIILAILDAINNVSYYNAKLMYKLNTTDVSIVQMDEEGQYLELRIDINQLLKYRM